MVGRCEFQFKKSGEHVGPSHRNSQWVADMQADSEIETIASHALSCTLSHFASTRLASDSTNTMKLSALTSDISNSLKQLHGVTQSSPLLTQELGQDYRWDGDLWDSLRLDQLEGREKDFTVWFVVVLGTNMSQWNPGRFWVQVWTEDGIVQKVHLCRF